MKVHLPGDKTYNTEEVAELVAEAMKFMGKRGLQANLTYSASDVYWTLHGLLDYVNRRTKGEFILKRLKKDSWGLEYTPQKAATRKADERHRRELKRTADLIQDLAGERPPWA